MICDAHVHFLSSHFFETLKPGLDPKSELGWDPPGTPQVLADRWVEELDRHSVSRAALIGSSHGDEDSVIAAVARHPDRFVGFFMFDPTRPDPLERVHQTLGRPGMRVVCLFPALHHYRVHDERAMRVVEAASKRPGSAIFVHCGVLSVGVRKRLGLQANFDIRLGNPLDLYPLALAFPRVPFIVPHFGAGMLREALMIADICPNIYLDTSSSNSWIRYLGLSLEQVFARALDVVGPERLLFGTDSSFFPRGWQRDIYEAQKAIVPADASDRIFHANFDRLFQNVTSA